MIIDSLSSIGDEQTFVQLWTVHLIIIDNDEGQFTVISELIEKSWLLRNCAGFVSEVSSGTNVIIGGEQPRNSFF